MPRPFNRETRPNLLRFWSEDEELFGTKSFTTFMKAVNDIVKGASYTIAKTESDLKSFDSPQYWEFMDMIDRAYGESFHTLVRKRVDLINASHKPSKEVINRLTKHQPSKEVINRLTKHKAPPLSIEPHIFYAHPSAPPSDFLFPEQKPGPHDRFLTYDDFIRIAFSTVKSLDKNFYLMCMDELVDGTTAKQLIHKVKINKVEYRKYTGGDQRLVNYYGQLIPLDEFLFRELKAWNHYSINYDLMSYLGPFLEMTDKNGHPVDLATIIDKIRANLPEYEKTPDALSSMRQLWIFDEDKNPIYRISDFLLHKYQASAAGTIYNTVRKHAFSKSVAQIERIINTSSIAPWPRILDKVWYHDRILTVDKAISAEYPGINSSDHHMLTKGLIKLLKMGFQSDNALTELKRLYIIKLKKRDAQQTDE